MQAKNQSKSAAMQSLRRIFRLATYANAQNITAEEAIERVEAAAWSRRSFLKTTGLASFGLAIPAIFDSCEKVANPDLAIRVAIVGGGVAGLNCAYQLKKQGYKAMVYEAAKRTGGRMYSVKDVMGTGLVSELGGEFIDSNHTDILNLATEFGLSLIDTFAPSEAALTKERFYFNNQSYTTAQMVAQFQQIATAMQADIDSLPDVCNYKNAAQLATLDNKSIAQYLDGIGCTGAIRKYIEVAYLGEFGLEMSEQSAVALLNLITTDTMSGAVPVYGESDERYKILGGNQLIVDKLAEKVSDRIATEHSLFKIGESKNGRGYTLYFNQNGKTVEVECDIAVITIPFSILKDVTIDVKAMTSAKLNAIRNLGMGQNSKLLIGTNTRLWRTQNYTGYYFTDLAIQTGWDNAQLQNNNTGAGGMTIFAGGLEAAAQGAGTPDSQAARYMTDLNKVFAGFSNIISNKNARMHWPTQPFTKGSYAAYRVGQYQTIAGREAEPVGNILFAGEHTSLDFQGYMNGGAETGRRAANEILALIKKK